MSELCEDCEWIEIGSYDGRSTRCDEHEDLARVEAERLAVARAMENPLGDQPVSGMEVA